jgi:hypothetical protein
MSFNDSNAMSPRHNSPPINSHSLQPELGSVSSSHRIGRPSTVFQMDDKEAHMDIEQSGGTISGPRQKRQPSAVLKKMAYQMMSYPLVYMLIWTIPTSIRIYQSVTGKPAPFGIATVDKACIVIQGFADAIIYGVNETSVSAWRERFSKAPPSRPVQGFEVNIQHDIMITRSERAITAPSLDEGIEGLRTPPETYLSSR